MTPDPRLPGLLADLLAVAEYLGDLGLGDLVPPLPPRPEAGAAAGPGGGRADPPRPPPPTRAPPAGGAT
ncbi:MAG: protein phosphatase, partial [Deltaproteobacteria bacterium]|nr:protein phosphatase [Deltaproteobacteria bacterium]